MRRVRRKIQNFFQYRDFLAPFRRLPIELVIAERAPSRLISILGCFGYLLALMNLVDFIGAVIPPQAQNPVWELAAMNLMLAHVWFFFVAFGLILTSYILRYRLYPQSGVWAWELTLFKSFRGLALFISVVCLLMAPLIFVDTLRVHRINQQQINETSQVQLTPLAEAERRLGEISDLSQLRSLLGQNAPALEGRSLGEIKARFQTDLQTKRSQIAQQAQIARSERRTALLKSSSRNFLAALVASFGLGFMVWKTMGMFP